MVDQERLPSQLSLGGPGSTYTTSGMHWDPALLRSCSLRRSLVSRTSKTQRSVSWSTKDQSKSKTTRFLTILLASDERSEERAE